MKEKYLLLPEKIEEFSQKLIGKKLRFIRIGNVVIIENGTYPSMHYDLHENYIADHRENRQAQIDDAGFLQMNERFFHAWGESILKMGNAESSSRWETQKLLDAWNKSVERQ
ncbi:MAG: hypothetical protein ABI758_03650 [Candidatus Woesebacteria bacterium]